MTVGMDPARVVELLNEHMIVLTKVVHEHGGVVDKFVGDLVMALFGVPGSHGDDPLRAAECARGMMRARRDLDAVTGRPVQIGIGVAYGEVLAGCMGSDDRLNYTVLGERVNLAEREPERVAALERLLAEHESAQVPPAWGPSGELPINLDKTLLDADAPDDEYIYWPN